PQGKFHLWKVYSRFQYAQGTTALTTASELKAQSALDEAVRRDQHYRSVARRHWDVALGQEVADIRLDFHVAGEHIRKRLPDLHAEVGVDLIDGLAVGVEVRDGRAAQPLVARRELGAQARHR